MKSIRTLLEGEIEKAQSALATRDIVDQLQDTVEKLNKLKVEELVALKETLRSSLGADVAEQFFQVTDEALGSAIDAVTQARDTVDQAALGVSGEGDMPAAGAEPMMGTDTEGGENEMPEAPVTDVAAGGEEPLGRGKREARERDLRRMVESLERKIETQKREVAEGKMKKIAEKAKNRYAIGMAAAMKQTGDKPPLKKSTIVKAHEIAKSIKEANSDDSLISEKWEGAGEVKATGEYSGKTIGQLEKMLSSLKASGPHSKGSADYKKMKQVMFAIRAKRGWKGGVEESAKPDFLDFDKDGDRKESMKKALKDKAKKK